MNRCGRGRAIFSMLWLGYSVLLGAACGRLPTPTPTTAPAVSEMPAMKTSVASLYATWIASPRVTLTPTLSAMATSVTLGNTQRRMLTAKPASATPASVPAKATPELSWRLDPASPCFTERCPNRPGAYEIVGRTIGNKGITGGVRVVAMDSIGKGVAQTDSSDQMWLGNFGCTLPTIFNYRLDLSIGGATPPIYVWITRSKDDYYPDSPMPNIDFGSSDGWICVLDWVSP